MILIVVTGLLKAAKPPQAPWPSHVLGTFGFSVLVPLTALIIGTSVLGAEIDDGSVIHLLATPVRRSSVIVTKYVVATVLTMVFAAVPELIAALISGGGRDNSRLVAGGFQSAAAINSGKFAIGLFVGALVGAIVVQRAVHRVLGGDHACHRAVGLALRAGVGSIAGATSSAGRGLLSIGHYSLGIANVTAHDGALNVGPVPRSPRWSWAPS